MSFPSYGPQMRHHFLPLSRTPAAYRMPARPTLHAVGQIFLFEWRLIAAYAFCAVLLGAVYCLVTPKVYEASVQIVPGDFTTKSTGSSTASLANILLNGPMQSDSVKRFITVLYSPDLAHRLVAQNKDAVFTQPQPGWIARSLGTSSAQPVLQDTDKRVRKFQSALGKINFTDSKETLATEFTYRAVTQKEATSFLSIAIGQADELLRQYNLSEIQYDDAYLNKVIGTAQNVDVRLALAQKLMETQLRRMDAERSEYFSVRALGPVEVTEGPVWPQKKLILPGMLMLGTLTGLVAAFVRVYARNRNNG